MPALLLGASDAPIRGEVHASCHATAFMASSVRERHGCGSGRATIEYLASDGFNQLGDLGHGFTDGATAYNYTCGVSPSLSGIHMSRLCML